MALNLSQIQLLARGMMVGLLHDTSPMDCYKIVYNPGWVMARQESLRQLIVEEDSGLISIPNRP